MNMSILLEENAVNNATRLFPNIQFIYELELARWEFSALAGIDGHGENLRNFGDGELPSETVSHLKRRTAYLQSVRGDKTDYAILTAKNRTRSPNQFLTHWIYPYKGKFHPQMIRAIFNIIGVKVGDLVLDPFVGSGTAAVEAQLLGARFIGFDASPVCEILGQVKTQSHEVLELIEEHKSKVIASISSNLTLFEGSSSFDKVISEFRDERVRRFFQVARLLSLSDNVRRGRELASSFARNVEAMVGSSQDYGEVTRTLDISLHPVNIQLGDARNLPLEAESVDAIVTSPPYSIALDYVANDAHSLEAMGYDVERIREDFIGVRGRGKERVELFEQDMQKSLDEMFRVLKCGGHCVLILGNATVNGSEVLTVQNTITHCLKLGFELVRTVEKTIFGLYNIMQSEKILVFRKAEII